MWGLTKRCPACGRGGLFRRWFRIVDRCPRCGLKFERIEGHWIGAIGMNTIVTFGSILVLMITAVVMFHDSSVPRWVLAAGLMAAALVIPPLLDPFTRTFWTAIDVALRPLEPFEVDWNVVAPDAVPGAADAGKETAS